MNTSKSKPALTIGRIVGLVAIGLLVLGLGYLHFGTGDDRVSVPRAHTPARSSWSRVTTRRRTAATRPTAARSSCRSVGPIPESRLIALPVTRIRARSANPGAPVFRLEGGPGITNMEFSKASRIAGNHDVVLLGYRGIDGSVRLDCPEVVSALKHSTGFLTAKSQRAYANGFRDCATRLKADGVDLAGYTLPERADDIETARVAMGYKQIDLFSESAGTRTAMIYAWRHPASVHRSIMLAVNPPGHFLYDAKTTDALIGHYSELCKQDGSCSARTNDLAASMRRTSADMPDHFAFFPIDKGNVKLTSFFGLMESTYAAEPLSGPEAISAWLSASKGDASGFWFQSLAARLLFPESFVWGDVGAASRADVGAAQRYFASGPHRADSILGNAATEFVWAGGRMPNAWPANASDNQYSKVRVSRVPTLLIGGTLDFATPARNATRELLPYLPNGHQVVLKELGHTISFWNYEPKASTRLLNAFYDERQGRRLALHQGDGRLHARGHAHRARQGHRRDDGRPRADRAAVVAADVAPRAPAWRLRAQGECRAPVGVPARARPRRLVHRPADRAARVPDRRARRRARRVHLDRAADRPRRLSRLGQRRACRHGRGGSASPAPWQARSSAPGSGSTRRPGSSRSSPPSPVPSSART